MMVGLMLTLLMLQLQSFQKTVLVLLTAPLGIIGVVLALLVTHQPVGFVALLGIISLAGMIMRNSVILVDQIDQDVKAGHSLWDAIIESTVRRFRPIMLTAAAAVLAMIPLSRSVFWGPMAIAIMGGLAWVALTGVILTAYVGTWLFALCRAQATDVTAVLVCGAIVTAVLNTGAQPAALAPAAIGLALIAAGGIAVAAFAARSAPSISRPEA